MIYIIFCTFGHLTLYSRVTRLQSALNHLNTILLLQCLEQRGTNVHSHRSKNTLLLNGTLKDLLHSNTTGHTNQLSHGRVAGRVTVLAQGRGAGLLRAVLVFDLELVLQHDHVTLTRLVLHLLLESSAQGVQGVTAGDRLLVGEETDPAQTGEKAVPLLVVGEGGLGLHGGDEVCLRGGGGAQDLGGSFLPGGGAVEDGVGLVLQEADVDKDLDHLGETLETEGTADDGLGLGDLVALAEGGRVTVGVADEGEAGVDEVGLGGGHQVGAVDADDLAILVDLGGVAEGQEDTTAGPGELVAQRVVGALGGGETTAEGDEAGDLAPGGVDLGDGLDGVQVVNTLGYLMLA